MRRLIWSEASLRDVDNIDEFLLKENPAAAGRIARAIRASVLRLIDYPKIGRAFDEPFRVLGVRTTPYLLVYRLRDDAVEIARIRHAREDWMPQGEAEL